MPIVISFQCPQCGAGFEQKHIINIYTPGDLFDGCSRMQVPFWSVVPFWSIVLELISFQLRDLKKPGRSCLNCVVPDSKAFAGRLISKNNATCMMVVCLELLLNLDLC